MTTLIEEELKPEQFKVKKDIKMEELTKVLGEKYGIMPEMLQILKRNPMLQLGSVEQLNSEKDSQKSLA